MSRIENTILNNNLKIDLKQYLIYNAIGRPRNAELEAEESYFVINITKEEAIELGVKYNQNALVYGCVNCKPKQLELV